MLPSVTFEIHVLHHIFSKGRGPISRCVLLSKWCKGHPSTIHKWAWICLNPSLATHTPNQQILRGWGLELESTLELPWIVSLTAKDFCKQLQLLSFHPLNIHRGVFDLYVLQRGAVHGESLRWHKRMQTNLSQTAEFYDLNSRTVTLFAEYHIYVCIPHKVQSCASSF